MSPQAPPPCSAILTLGLAVCACPGGDAKPGGGRRRHRRSSSVGQVGRVRVKYISQTESACRVAPRHMHLPLDSVSQSHGRWPLLLDAAQLRWTSLVKQSPSHERWRRWSRTELSQPSSSTRSNCGCRRRRVPTTRCASEHAEYAAGHASHRGVRVSLQVPMMPLNRARYRATHEDWPEPIRDRNKRWRTRKYRSLWSPRECVGMQRPS